MWPVHKWWFVLGAGVDNILGGGVLTPRSPPQDAKTNGVDAPPQTNETGRCGAQEGGGPADQQKEHLPPPATRRGSQKAPRTTNAMGRAVPTDAAAAEDVRDGDRPPAAVRQGRWTPERCRFRHGMPKPVWIWKRVMYSAMHDATN